MQIDQHFPYILAVYCVAIIVMVSIFVSSYIKLRNNEEKFKILKSKK